MRESVERTIGSNLNQYASDMLKVLKSSRMCSAGLSWFALFKNRLNRSEMLSRLSKGVFWSLVASVGSRVLALIASVVIARALGKTGFGELGMIQSTLDMFGALAGFGLGLTSTKFVAECRFTNPERAGRIIALSNSVAWGCGAVTAVALFLSATWLAKNAIAAPELAELLRVSAISILLSAVSGAQVGALSGFERFKEIARVTVIVGVLSVVLRVVGTFVLGLNGTVYGMVLAQIAGCFLNQAAISKAAGDCNVVICYSRCLKESNVLWQFSFPAVLGSLTSMPVYWICNAMLVSRPSGYSEMGVFNAANQWFFVVLFIPGFIGQAAIPVLCERLGHGDWRQSAELFKTLIKWNGVALIPMITMVCFSKPIMACYGEGFASGWPTMSICTISAGILALQMPTAYVLAARGKMWLALLMNVGWGGIFVGLNIAFLEYGALGMAFARLAAVCAHCAWSFLYVAYEFRTLRHADTPQPRDDFLKCVVEKESCHAKSNAG